MPDHWGRVNTWTTAPFDRDREFTGQGVLILYAASNQTDMNVMVKLSLLTEVPHCPRVNKVSQSWLRASHRAKDLALTTEVRPFHKYDRVKPIKAGSVYQLRIELLPMSFLVRQGKRMRLETSNWESAIITEAPMTHWYGQKVGTDTYHHDATHTSCLRLHERTRS